MSEQDMAERRRLLRQLTAHGEPTTEALTPEEEREKRAHLQQKVRMLHLDELSNERLRELAGETS